MLNSRLIIVVLAGQLVAASVSAQVQFHPLDLDPDIFQEGAKTFANPWSVSECLGVDEPIYGCTGVGTGTLRSRIDSWVVVKCTTRNIDCTGAGTPYACCVAAYPDAGNACCYEEGDNSYSGLGNSYCPLSICPDGCANQWRDQTKYKSAMNSYAPTGRTIEQDDLEKPCYIADCIGGHPCMKGGPEWDEPDYVPPDDPTQDRIFEIEPKDRFTPAVDCGGSYWSVQLLNWSLQTEDHSLYDSDIRFTVDERRFEIDTYNEDGAISMRNAVRTFDQWHLVEIERDESNRMTVYVDTVDVSLTPRATIKTSQLCPGTQFMCRGKDCDRRNQQEYQGKVALHLARRSAPTAQERSDFRAWIAAKYGLQFRGGFPAGGRAGPEGSLAAWQATLRPGPRCPEGSTSPEVFTDWYGRAMRLSAEVFKARHGRLPAEDELLPLLPGLIEVNLRILCNCRSRHAGEKPASESPGTGSCVSNATTLCLDGRRPGDGRFEVRVAFRKVPTGVPCGEGQAQPAADRRVNREGLFWCSEPENPDFLVKVVDDCTVEGHFSVVWSVARGVELTATITDTLTGSEKVYLVDRAAPQTNRRAFPCEP